MKTCWSIIAIAAILFLAGCGSGQHARTQATGLFPSQTNTHFNLSPPDEYSPGKPDFETRQVAHLQEVGINGAQHFQRSPETVYEADSGITGSAPTSFPGTLAELEQLALVNNPAIARMAAKVEALKGKMIQAGLPPNPTAGIAGQEIGEDGDAGRYGFFYGREIVRGNKLGRSEAVVGAELDAAVQQLEAQRQKLLTDVRIAFFDLLVAQQRVSISGELVSISQNAVDVSTGLFEARETARTAVLQAELELNKAIVTQQQADNERLAARTRLAALFGESDLPVEQIDGNPFEMVELETFEKSFDLLVNTSPEVAALFAQVEQAKRQLDRECVEPVPNLTWQTTVLYDTVSDNMITSFQVGMPIPTLNRNEGAIHQARHRIIAAERAAETKALQLRQRLTSAYEQYIDARIQIDTYRSEVLPRAEETLQLFSDGYRSGEVEFLQLLTAQRTYSELNMTYLNKLQQLWQQYVTIEGMLLSGSLN